MARETTQASPGTARPAAAPIDPAALFTLEEAAGRVRVPVEDLEARCDRGELLFEVRRRGRSEVRCVRGVDLAEAFPGAPGLGPADGSPVAASSEAASSDAVPSGAVSSGAVPPPAAPPRPESAPARSAAAASAPDAVAEAVRGSSTTREALIGLCQDLETRLDLAERERQASTASLLMAQRRVLELELHGRSRPWARAGGALLGLMSISALALGVLLPGWIEEGAEARGEALRAGLAADLGALESTVEGLNAAASEERARLSGELARRDAIIEAERERVEALVAEAAEERRRADAARAAGEQELQALAARLAEADRLAVRRSAELDVVVGASARDRARFDERLAASERELAAARAALADERSAAADARSAFEARLVAADDRRDAEQRERAAEVAGLRDELRLLVAAARANQAGVERALEEAAEELEALRRRAEPVEVWTLEAREREPLWARALRLASGR